MSVAFDHRDPGTSEDAWIEYAPWTDAPRLKLDMRKAIVFAAHPDDETLGAGGLITIAAARGLPVTVVLMTDGEASHPGSSSGRDLRRERRREVLDALSQLHPECSVTFAGLPDSGLRESIVDVRRHVRAALEGEDPRTTTVFSTWSGDGHRDHRILAEVLQEESAGGFEVFAYPIWLWHWGDAASVDASEWCVLPLDPAARRRKASALRHYASQTEPLSGAAGDEPILHEGMRRHFARPFEVFVQVRASRGGSVAPEWFEERYARRADPWHVDTRWYEERKRALLVAALPRLRYRRMLEVGCGTGALTEILASRADELVAVDVSTTALASARQRLDDVTSTVRLLEGDVRAEFPDGVFDAVVLSEVGYYWSEQDLRRVLDAIEKALTPDGVLIACHWRHPIPDAPQSGDGVHRILARREPLTGLVHHIEDDFVLDVLSRSPRALSVARETGVIR